RFAQRIAQRAQLDAIRNVAGEDDEAPRLRLTEERAFVLRERKPGAAIDGARAHGSAAYPFAGKQLAPSALSLEQKSAAEALSENEPVRRRYHVPFSPRSTETMLGLM